MLRKIVEPSRSLPVSGESDVVIVGGGIAGVAAALAAARNGATVCLIEKENALGGLATLGIVTVYLPLCDGNGNQVIGGLGEELLRLSIKDGSDRIPPGWESPINGRGTSKHRYQVTFNPITFMLELERLAVEEGIKLHYDTRFCSVHMNGDRIDAVIVENKSGRSAILCKTVVDASGDADVCAAAGEKTVSLDTNVRCGWFYYVDDGSIRLKKYTEPFGRYAEKLPGGGPWFAGDNADDVTQMMIASRDFIREFLAKERGDKTGREFYPILVPTIPCFRSTRRLKGRYELEEEDEGRRFEDTVGMTGDWRRKGPVYHIPFRSLRAVKTANLTAVGRCMSSNTAWDITRAIPACAVTGEAAGTASAIASRKVNGYLDSIDIRELQDRLKNQGVIFR